MGRNHSKAITTRRNQGTKESVQRIILYCEGQNTEPSYFELLKRNNCKVVPLVVPGHGIGSCMEFVVEANKKYNSLPKAQRERYSRKWLAFDCDGHEDFAESIKYARECGFEVAFSNMCIEYWFLLHFENQDGSAIPLVGDSHSEALIRRINKHIAAYNKKAEAPVALYDSDSKSVEEDFFDLMLAIDPVSKKSRIVLAYERAKAIHEGKKAIGAEFRESVTTVYELLQVLGVIEKNKDGFVLYRR